MLQALNLQRHTLISDNVTFVILIYFKIVVNILLIV